MEFGVLYCSAVFVQYGFGYSVGVQNHKFVLASLFYPPLLILLRNKNIKIPTEKDSMDTPFPTNYIILGRKKWVLLKLSNSSKTLNMTSRGFGVMFEGDIADKWAAKFPQMLVDEARIPIGVSRNLL